MTTAHINTEPGRTDPPSMLKFKLKSSNAERQRCVSAQSLLWEGLSATTTSVNQI